MKNPWLDFEISDHMVHPLDRDSVDSHNKIAKPEYKFLTHLAPEPWIGNINAPLVVLLANPGATKSDMQGKPQRGVDEINQLSIANLKHEITDYPHFFFNPKLANTDGYKWYERRFGHLIRETSAENVSKKVMTCEMVPYHSFSWKKPKAMPPTQEFTFSIINDAIDREAIILIGRGKTDWMKYLPKLRNYKRYFQPASPQCAYLSPKNYRAAFKDILGAIS